MLRRIHEVSGVGLFHSARGGANLPFGDLTLIYGENGRGKSTLASVLAAASTGDRSRVIERATIDSDVPALVDLEMGDGTRVKFANGKWHTQLSDVLVFDSAFIEENVHSGHEITTDHRKNLLSFALGGSAVAAQSAERDASAAMKALEGEIRLAVAELKVHSGGLEEGEFTALPYREDFDADILLAKTVLEAAKAKEVVALQPGPHLHEVPDVPFREIEEVLGTTLEDIHAEAEEMVNRHFETIGSEGVVEWIAEGQKFLCGDGCPFCGQLVVNVELIKSYKSFFNDAYENLKSSVQTLKRRVQGASDQKVASSLRQGVTDAIDVINSWRVRGLVLDDPGVYSEDLLAADLSIVGAGLNDLLAAKLADLGSASTSPTVLEEVKKSWGRVIEVFNTENRILERANSSIKLHKLELARSDLDSLEHQLSRLELAKVRHSKEVVGQIQTISGHRALMASAEADRKQARLDLKRIMDETLDRFSGDINEHLKKQFTSFRIDKLSANFAGGAPRTAYGIKLRERDVDLKGGVQSFRTALSESDKRAMAFAFFMASTFADPDLASKVVVVDDPMSSFDVNRRANTVSVLKTLAEKCGQLIVMAHDPAFLLDLDTALSRAKREDAQGSLVPLSRVAIKIEAHRAVLSKEPYSNFAECLLSRECESKYASHYRRLMTFVSDPSMDCANAASSVRPLLEGYLHRRFPSHLPVNCMFGTAVTAIEKASAPSPLVSAQGIVGELRRIAYFGGDSHHDTSPDTVVLPASSIETLGYVTDALAIVHGDRP